MNIITKITNRIFNIVEEKYNTFSYKTLLGNSFSINSHLTISERVLLYKLAKEKGLVLEIGSYVGASACCFGAAIEETGKGEVWCIDTWNNDAMTEGNMNTFEAFKSNTSQYEKYIKMIRGFSTDVINELSKEIKAVDLLFVDGDHSYNGVKADWEAYKHLLKSGSIVVFHDWGWAEGVKRVIEEDVKSKVSNHGSLPNLWWGAIK